MGRCWATLRVHGPSQKLQEHLVQKQLVVGTEEGTEEDGQGGKQKQGVQTCTDLVYSSQKGQKTLAAQGVMVERNLSSITNSTRIKI